MINDHAIAVVMLLAASVALISGAVAVGHTLARRSIQRLAAHHRARVLGGLLAAPALAGPMLAIWSMAPHWWLGTDAQCTLHAASHGCGWHLPHGHDALLSWALVLVAATFAFAGLRRLQRLIALRRQLIHTLKLSQADPVRGVMRLPTSAPMAFTAGWVRPRIYLSDGLIAALDDEALETVIAHERAHARRRDGIWTAALGALSLVHVPAIRRRLLRDWQLAIELCCDAEVATTPARRLALADCLVRVARLTGQHRLAHPSVCAIDGSQVEHRVRALLRPDDMQRTSTVAIAAGSCLALVLSIVAFAPVLHELLEWI